MKRILFLLVSAILTGTSYASNLSKDIVARVTNGGTEISVNQQNQPLILEQNTNLDSDANYHYSHSSHGSHGSHGSHSSHSSHSSHYSAF